MHKRTLVAVMGVWALWIGNVQAEEISSSRSRNSEKYTQDARQKAPHKIKGLKRQPTSEDSALKRVVVSNLQGVYRNGQVFLTWEEMETPEGITFNVYMSDKVITADKFAEAAKIGHHVERHSARDWWQDPASFFKDEEPAQPVGFLIKNGGSPLDPRGGLFVHTVTPQDSGPRYYAVTSTGPDGFENRDLILEENSLQQPIVGQHGTRPFLVSRGNWLCLALLPRPPKADLFS